MLCKVSFALNEVPNKNSPNPANCIKQTIKRCVFEEVVPKIGHFCAACGEFFYVQRDLKSCTAKTPVKISGCLWGGVISGIPGARPSCFRCYTGLALNFRRDNCIQSPLKGCYWYNEQANRCQACDAFNGYSMQPDGSCQEPPVPALTGKE